MSVFEIILISIGLAMDAFGVSIGKGLTMPVGENGRKVTLAFLFGLFQFLMPLIGWLIGRQFIDVIADWDHWIIFGLLGYLGIAMIREGLSDDDEEEDETTFSKLEKFSSDKKSLKYLIDYLTNIYNKVPDEDGEREIVDLWYDNGQNPSYEEWYNHLGSLIEKLKFEYES